VSPDLGFPLFLGLTVVCLVGALITGFRARVPLHLTFVTSALVCLGAAIWFAIGLGPLYDLETAQPITGIHLTIAKVATAAYLLPIVTGLRTLRQRTPTHKRVHLICALVVVVLTLAATATGAWMLWLAERIA